MRRYAETFFRYWILVLLPIIILPTAEFVIGRHAPKTVVVSANIWVTQNPTGYNNQWASAAQNETDYFNDYLQSPSDIAPILRHSPAYQRLLRTDPVGAYQLEQRLLQGFTILPKGQYIVNVSYSGQDRQLGIEVVNGLINAVQQQQEQANTSQTQISMTAAQTQVNAAKKRLSQASVALHGYMDRHGYTESDLNNPTILDTTLATLVTQFKSAQDDYVTDQGQVAKLRDQNVAPISSAQQASFYLKDHPSAIVTSSLKKILMNVLLALAAALLLSGGFLVVKTLLDRSLRYPDEVPEMLDLPVLAVIPYNNALSTQGRGLLPAPGRATARRSIADAS